MRFAGEDVSYSTEHSSVLHWAFRYCLPPFSARFPKGSAFFQAIMKPGVGLNGFCGLQTLGCADAASLLLLFSASKTCQILMKRR